ARLSEPAAVAAGPRTVGPYRHAPGGYRGRFCFSAHPSLQCTPIAQTSLSLGYTCTIQPKSSGTNLPPASSQASRVEIEPAMPNFGLFCHASNSRPFGGKQKFTCSCHCYIL